MKTTSVLAATLLLAVTGRASTIYDNFTGYNAFWHPLGYSDTATYGETFTAPTNGDTNLQSIGFYMGGPVYSGDIVLRAYVAPWTGAHIGAVLFTSPTVTYGNSGNAELTFSTGGLGLTSGAAYVAFLSISQHYGESSGQSFVSSGNASIPGGSFVYCNNGGSFDALFSTTWSGTGLKPDWAFTATFEKGSISGVPEPGSLILLGTGLLSLLAIRRTIGG